VRGVVDYRLLTNIYATNNLAGIVISVKILGLKFLRYIADILNFSVATDLYIVLKSVVDFTEKDFFIL